LFCDGVGGFVTVAVDLDAAGQPTGVHVLDEQPVDYGFGAAATLIVQTFRFTNPRQRPTQFNMKVKFDMADDEPHPPAQLPPPQSPVGG